jgi:hypothetical protein
MIVDKILAIDAPDAKYGNEIQTLQDLNNGLKFLYNSVRPWELKILENRPGKNILFVGSPPEFLMEGIPPNLYDYLPAMFHWFSTSLINYARLCGFILCRVQNIITDADVEKYDDKNKIKAACNDYVNNIPELEQIKKWRNKVSGHFALTDPRNDDNIATLEETVRNPIGFSNSRFRTNIMVSTKTVETVVADLDLPSWALTETFEALSNRFWDI